MDYAVLPSLITGHEEESDEQEGKGERKTISYIPTCETRNCVYISQSQFQRNYTQFYFAILMSVAHHLLALLTVLPKKGVVTAKEN